MFDSLLRFLDSWSRSELDELNQPTSLSLSPPLEIDAQARLHFAQLTVRDAAQSLITAPWSASAAPCAERLVPWAKLSE
jgi:hypothetical protein